MYSFRPAICSIFAICTCGFASHTIADTASRIDDAIDFRVPLGFMGSVLVERNGQVILEKGYGQSIIEWDIPNTPSSRFRIASITKQFTAAAILLLEERGEVATTDLIGNYLSDLPAAWHEITIFHLLTHSSGIADLSEQEEPYERYLVTTPGDTIRQYLNTSLEHSPGEVYRYSNVGYVVLGAVIEEVSGVTYGDFVSREIFQPLAMNDSGYELTAEIVPKIASGYRLGPNGLSHADFIEMSRPYAAGSLYSTTRDLLRWNRALYGGELLSPESVGRMTTAYKDSYGFGVISEDVLGQKKIWHNGAISGFSSVLAYYPGLDATVVVLSNIEAPAAETVAREIEFVLLDADVVLPSEHTEIAMSAETLSQFIGVFEFREGLEMEFSVTDGQLFSKATDLDEMPLMPYSESGFFTQAPYIRFEFRLDDEGEFGILDYFQRGEKYTLFRK